MIGRGLTVLLLILLGACGEPALQTQAITVSGHIVAPADTALGTVHVRLYHAWALEGELRHPLQFITEFETKSAAFTHRFDYPLDLGQGLVVYAWQDTDGDGVFCTPTFRDELSGLSEVTEFPADTLAVDVTLEQPCAGPDWFFPPRF